MDFEFLFHQEHPLPWKGLCFTSQHVAGHLWEVKGCLPLRRVVDLGNLSRADRPFLEPLILGEELI